MKKFLFAALLLMCAAPAFAANYYLGGSLAYDSYYQNDLRYTSFSPRLVGGYGGWWSRWIYMSAELYGTPKDFRRRNDDLPNQTLEEKYSFGASLIPGVYLDNLVMGYARFGFQFANFNQTNSIRRGLQTGLGLDYAATPCWHVRGEYDYTRFDNLGIVGSPQLNEYALTVIYHFYPSED